MPVKRPFAQRAARLFRHGAVAALILQLNACGKGEPIPLTDNDYLGTWLHEENAFGNNLRIDNRLLAFYDDSTISYFRCSKRGGSSVKVSVASGYISEFTATRLTAEADLFITTAKLKFRIDLRPFQRDGDWYIKMDGLEYRRLHEGEPGDYKSWPCFADEQE